MKKQIYKNKVLNISDKEIIKNIKIQFKHLNKNKNIYKIEQFLKKS